MAGPRGQIHGSQTEQLDEGGKGKGSEKLSRTQDGSLSKGQDGGNHWKVRTQPV